MVLFGTSDPSLVSYLLADGVIAQSLLVVVIVAVFWLVKRELPELGVLVEDTLYLVTGMEYDAEELLPHGRVRANAGTDEPMRRDHLVTDASCEKGHDPDGRASDSRPGMGPDLPVLDSTRPVRWLRLFPP